MTHLQRLKLAKNALIGLSVGDAFGESFFGERGEMLHFIQNKKIPTTSWEFTDDTVMAITVFNQLKKNGKIIQDEFAKELAVNHDKDVNRGYGATARRILREISNGGNWRDISKNVFEGMGSMGNGASMRVSPIGAYFSDDLDTVKNIARKSAEITHFNEEGITGAIAVAIGTAISTDMKLNNRIVEPAEFINRVLDFLPDTDTKSKIKKSLSVPYSFNIETVKTILGNGSKIMAQDTVPFAIWCAAYNLNNFENALWKAVSVLGDRDTICAIVAGIVVMSSETENLPEKWFNNVESIERSAFFEKK